MDFKIDAHYASSSIRLHTGSNNMCSKIKIIKLTKDFQKMFLFMNKLATLKENLWKFISIHNIIALKLRIIIIWHW